jgi:hypothetical protein
VVVFIFSLQILLMDVAVLIQHDEQGGYIFLCLDLLLWIHMLRPGLVRFLQAALGVCCKKCHEVPETGYSKSIQELQNPLDRGREALKSSKIQWIVYSWIFSAKVFVLFFNVSPKKDYEEQATIVTVMVLTPILYTLHTFRSLPQLFNKVSLKDKFPSDASATKDPEEKKAAEVNSTGGNGNNNASLSRQGPRSRATYEDVTREAVLLQDMIWHVVIDMSDMLALYTRFSRPDDEEHGVGVSLIDAYPDTISGISTCAGIFIFLGFFFHQQSFPNIGISGAGGFAPASAATSGHANEKGGIDVVKARKRSAMVSILMIDLPFFVIRTYIYFMMLSLHSASLVVGADSGRRLLAEAANTTTMINQTSAELTLFETTKKPQLDKWWIKNGLCLVLQATQLRFVQQADMQEQSQNAPGHDVHQGSASRKLGKQQHGTLDRDPDIMKAWREKRLEKTSEQVCIAETEVEDAEVTWGSDPSEETKQSVKEKLQDQKKALEDVTREVSAQKLEMSTGDPNLFTEVVKSQLEELRDKTRKVNQRIQDLIVVMTTTPKSESPQPLQDVEPKSQESLEAEPRSYENKNSAARQVKEKARGNCRPRCCCCRCSSWIWLHAAMGLSIGWLIAKHDFQRSQERLLLSMGEKQYDKMGAAFNF